MMKAQRDKMKLLRTIVLETGEVIPANTVLNSGKYEPLETLAPGKNHIPASQIEEQDIIYFCRIPRHCIQIQSLTGMLKNLLIEGDNSIAPFSCTFNEYEHGVALIEDPMHLPPHLTASYDNEFNPINIIEFCTFKDLLKGKFHNLPCIEKVTTGNYYTYCIVYHYNECNELRFKEAKSAHFYKELRSYQYQVDFDDIDIGDEIDCYITEKSKAFQMQHLSIIDKGKGTEWWESFRRSHSSICGVEKDYIPLEDEIHLFARCEYYDKSVITGRKELVILHQSTYTNYLMTKTSKLKTLMEP